MTSADVEMNENVQLSVASPQKELRKRKRDSASVSPKKGAQGGRKAKAAKIVESDPEEEDEEMDEEDEDEEEEEAFEVEKIIGHKLEKGEVLYHVKWLNFSDDDNTFEPMSSLSTATEKIEEYKKSLSAEALKQLEGKKKGPVKKAVTPAAKAKITPKTAKKTNADDDEDEEVAVKKTAGRASASKSKAQAKTKSVADFFKAKPAAKATTDKDSNKENEKQNGKKELTTEEKLAKIMDTQVKGADFAKTDPIGSVVEKGAAVMHTLIKYDADPEKLFAAVAELKAERLKNEELDKNAGNPRGSDKKRDNIYTMAEALENAMWWYADREQKLRNPEVKEELKAEPKADDSVVSSNDPIELCTVSHIDGGSTVPAGVELPKREVKDEVPDMDEQMDEEAGPSKTTAKATPQAKKAASNKKVASMFTPFKCKTCPEAFTTLVLLNAHKKKEHA